MICESQSRLDPRSTILTACSLSLEHRQIKRPSLSLAGKNLYLQAPPQLELATRPNLEKTLSELIASGDVLTVTDSGLPFSLDLQVNFE